MACALGRPCSSPGARDLSLYSFSFMEGTTDCVIFLDDEWRFAFLNQQATAEIASGRNLLGVNFWDAFPEAVETPLWYRCRQAMTKRTIEIFEFYHGPLQTWYETHIIPAGDGLTVSFRNINERRTAAETLGERESQLTTVFNQTVVGILHRDLNDRVLMVNQRFCDILGRSRDELNGASMCEFIHSDDAPGVGELFRKHRQTGEPLQIEKRYVRPDGSIVWCAVNASFVKDETGKVVSAISVIEDISDRNRDVAERLRAEAELQESRLQLATLINNLPGLVYKCEPRSLWSFKFMSEGAQALTGYSAAEFTDRRIAWADIVHPDDLKKREKAIDDSIQQGGPFSIIYRIMTRAGDVRWVIDRGQCTNDASGKVVFLEGFVSDVTDQQETEERIRWTANHDSLTQLPNRTLFHVHLENALNESARMGRKVGLMLLDVDHLKQINDAQGHDAGDMILRAVAERLRNSLRNKDIIARNGGDEFGIILPDIGCEQEIWDLIELMVGQLQAPVAYGGNCLDCRFSIGIGLWPDHADKSADLLKQANIALHTAKSTGRGKAMMFAPSMHAEAQRKVLMLNRARQAIGERRIKPFYQSKVALSTGGIAGFEALLRWRNARGEIESPAAIQAAFDEPHLSAAIGQEMQELVFADMRQWLDAGLEFGHVALNASAAEFRDDNFAEDLLSRLRAARIPARYFELEVTETVFLGQGSEHVGRALRTLSEEGVRIALDDFGTGYASLSHLKQFPVDIIKIDRSFVQDLAINPDDVAILSAILDLGRSLGLTIVAEGIETDTQAAYLRTKGCNHGQGYLFSRAIPSEHVPELVTSWQPKALLQKLGMQTKDELWATIGTLLKQRPPYGHRSSAAQ